MAYGSPDFRKLFCIVCTNVIIANEKAHWGLSRLHIGPARAFFQKSKFPFILSITERPGHARQLAAEAAAQKAEAIIVLGGDGTVNEVINGILTSGCQSIPPIGIIPCGSSNDLSKCLGIPQRLQQACRTIMNGKTKYVDIGRAGTEYFCVASSLGLLTNIAAESIHIKGLSGSRRYMAAALKVIAKMPSGWEMNIKADDRTFQGVYGVLLISNTPRFGGMTLAPGAKCDDGILDCVLVEMMGKRQALQMMFLAMRGALARHPKVTVFQAKSLSARMEPAAMLNNDGEVVPGSFSEIDYSILPQKLQVIC